MESELEQDLRDHIEMETRDNMERGMSAEDARLAALRKFGNVARIAEETRAVWRWMWAERLLQDTQYALRTLRRNPMFAAVALFTLALGIGMNAAVFSVVSGVLIKPLAYPDAERLAWLANYNSRFKFEASSSPDFSDWRRARSFEEMTGYLTVDSTILDGDQSAKHSFVSITPEFWRMAGYRAAAGRLFDSADRNVMVITWRLFEQRFGGDRSVVGRVVSVDGRVTTIVGVLPREFRFLLPSGDLTGMSGEAEAFTPAVLSPELQTRGRSILVMYVVGKLKPGVSIGQARAELQSIQDRVARENPSMRDFYSGAELRVTPLQEKLVGGSRRALVVLLAAVAFVLLIACANLGNLLLARVTVRQREIAIRAAIGAGRNRLARQFLVEGLTLTLLGGAAGLGMARGAIAALQRMNAGAVPRMAEVTIDWRVLLFTLGLAVAASVVFAMAPLISLPTGSLYAVLKDGGRGASAGPVGRRVRRLLVAAELGLALVLLTGAGLMVKSFARMNAHPAEFRPEKIGVMKVWLSGPNYRERPAALRYTQELLVKLRQFPGIREVSVMNASSSGGVEVEGRIFAPGQAPQAVYRTASAGYPRVVGLRLLKGRWTTDEEASPAVVVNESFVRRVFGKEEPLGQRLRIYGVPATIVGVAGDLKVSRLDTNPEPEVLVPYRQTTIFRRLDILFKSEAPRAVLADVRGVVQRIDPTQPPYGITTLEGVLTDSVAPRRFNLLLLGSFAAAALLLALIGIYGLMSYAVTQRRHEIGIRMALGARRGEIVGLVVRQGMTPALAGIGAGVAASLGLTRWMETLLFEVKPNDPWTFGVVAFGLTATALVAAWVPALKAARVDPIGALRYE
jgi:putative ABC transport system permease protein